VRTLLLVLIALFVDASTATAAITLALEQTPTGGSAGVTTLIYDGTKLRVHRSVGGRVRSFKVYDHATKTLLEVDLENKTYRELTENDALEVEKGGVTAPSKVTYEKAGTSNTIAGYACEVYRVFADGRLRNQGCFAPLGPEVVTKTEFEQMAVLMEGFQRFQSWRGEKRGKEPGYPIEQRFFNPDGKTVRLISVLKSISRAPVPASTFQVPAGPGWRKLSQ